VSRKALGKGIGALIADGQEERRDSSVVTEVALSALTANPHQPRREFSKTSLSELAESIRQKGVLQPILVEAGQDGSYTIIAGERRVRAARMAGLQKIPVIVRQFSTNDKLEIALIENIQREDLTPIEEAQAFKRLMETAGLSQEEVAAQVGKDRSTVANSLRLLKLPADMQEALDSGEMSPGHARAILMAVNPSDQTLLFRRVMETGISVREAEQMAAELNRGKKASGKSGKGRAQAGDGRAAPEIRTLEQGLIERLGTKVSIKGTSVKGRIEIQYYSSDDLERVCDIIQGQKK
jgi:ParB family chromosome partitioning protein